MGGEGPAVRFSGDSTTISSWANRIGLKPFNNQQQEAAYSKAREFFLERGLMLISDYGWKNSEDTTTTTSILHLSKTSGYTHLLLPASFSSLLEPSEVDKWSEMFNLFQAKRDRTNYKLIIDSPTPLADIFYLLQTLLPGMLLIYRIDDIDDIGEKERTCALPSTTWIELHKELLQTIFGDTERYDQLLAAAAAGLAEEVKMISSYQSYETYDDDDDSGFYTNWYGQREMKDFTACDKECGYCGTCDY